MPLGRAVRKNHVWWQILSVLQAVEVAIRLLQMTAAAGHFLQENHLYKSFRLLQRVKEGLLAIREDEGPQGRSAAAWPLQAPAADGQNMPEQWKFPACSSLRKVGPKAVQAGR